MVATSSPVPLAIEMAAQARQIGSLVLGEENKGTAFSACQSEAGLLCTTSPNV